MSYDNSWELFVSRDCNYLAPFERTWAHWGPMGPYRALKNDHRGHGSVHAKFQPVASHGDPFRANLVASTWYQALGTRNLVPSTWYQALGTKYVVPSRWCQIPRFVNSVHEPFTNRSRTSVHEQAFTNNSNTFTIAVHEQGAHSRSRTVHEQPFTNKPFTNIRTPFKLPLGLEQ